MDILLTTLCTQVQIAEMLHDSLAPLLETGNVGPLELSAAVFGRLAANARHLLMCLIAAGDPAAGVALQAFRRARAGEARAVSHMRSLTCVAMAA